MEGKLRVIISGGGTGGHIFPAISIADAIKGQHPNARILFVGAMGRMEMQRIPDAGYEIVGLPIMGFDRKYLCKNVFVIFKLLKSRRQAKRIIKQFRPHVVVGVGGYASGPILEAAGTKGIPTLIQEQNSYAGLTNKLLAKKAKKICVAYTGMEKFFPAKKIILTGNPVRQGLIEQRVSRKEASYTYGFDTYKKTILILGGSLGARSINQCLIDNLNIIRSSIDIQFIWQTGKIYYEQVMNAVKTIGEIPNLHIVDFIKNMEIAYAAADLIVSRAGAGSISEFCLLQKAVILVPSPNVTEDHQTKNVMALVDKQAAVYVEDIKVSNALLPTALATIRNDEVLRKLRINIATLALPNSAHIIAQEVYKLIDS
jgi:UDP-N-acetylglucosamine--N-acetylmuramyl-(pentapeptide) pyrophosphoryl-undecaprenol N-acetylglucosamine transferase